MRNKKRSRFNRKLKNWCKKWEAMNKKGKKDSVKNYKHIKWTKKNGWEKCNRSNQNFDIKIDKQFKKHKNIVVSHKVFGKINNKNLLLQEKKALVDSVLIKHNKI